LPLRYDAVYFDTYQESYADLRRFFADALPRLLAKTVGAMIKIIHPAS
jgi:hypothetical protein